MTKLNISIKQNRKFYPRRTPKKYYVEKLITDPIAANDFQIKIGGKFEPLLALDDDDQTNVEELYAQFKQAQ